MEISASRFVPTLPIPPPPLQYFNHQFITIFTDTIRLTMGFFFIIIIFFQVGVEIRDELQLLAASKVRHDIYPEVSKKRGMTDTI